MQEVSRQNFTEMQGFIEEDNLSKRNQRIRKAVLLYYIEDMTQQEISDELGVTRQTISEYLNSEEAKDWEPYFSSREKSELRDWLEKQFWQAYNESMEAFREIKNADEASYQTRLRAAKELQENQDRLASWFQEVGLIQKPKERKEVTERSKEADDVLERLQDAYREKQEKESLEASK